MSSVKRSSSGTPLKRSSSFGTRVSSMKNVSARKPAAPRYGSSAAPRARSYRPRTGGNKRKPTSTARSFWIIIMILAVFAVVYWINSGGQFQTLLEGFIPTKEYEAKIPPPDEDEIRVCFFDVGQGDSIMLQTAEQNVLIDTGEYSVRQAMLGYLRDAGVTTIDYLVATHPHSDHIGGMIPVINNMDVKNVVMTDAPGGTESYESFLEAIEDKNIPVTFPSAGDVITAGLIELTVLAPLKDYSDDLNNSSLVMRMLYGDTAFLFAGDAEVSSENDMLEAGSAVRANVLKAGHHGSDTASSKAFLDAVRPAAVVISCGRNNSYGHPHEEMLERVAAFSDETGMETSVYRTDLSGTIIMGTNGAEIFLYS